MLVDTISAAIDLGSPYFDHLPVQGGYFRGGYEIVELNEWFVSSGLYVPHPESFFHLFFFYTVKLLRSSASEGSQMQ